MSEPYVSQIELIGAITKSLARQGFKDANQRQLNAVIEAADLIVREYSTPHVSAVANSGLEKWLASDDTGISSLTMAKTLSPLAGIEARFYVPFSGSEFGSHPRDPDDLGRCVRLLDAVPELRPHLPAMGKVSPVWAALVGEWDQLEKSYREEFPSGKAPQTYRRMRELIEAGEKPGQEPATP